MTSSTIERREVTSSNIEAVSYDPLMNNLTVHFKNGTEYEYVGVPKDVFDGFAEAPSAGRYFQTSVKPYYDFLRLK